MRTDLRLREPVDALVSRLKPVADALVTVGDAPGTVLADPTVPESVRAEILRALMRLDLVDALADTLEMPGPFGIQRRLRPAIEVEYERGDAPGHPGTRHVFPAPDGTPVVVFPQAHVTADTLMAAGDLRVTHDELRRYPVLGVVRFRDDAPAGSGGRGLQFLVQNLVSPVYIGLRPPGGTDPLLIRLPSGLDHNPTSRCWVTVRLSGALAAPPGAWEAFQHRAFEPVRRECFAVLEVRAGSIP